MVSRDENNGTAPRGGGNPDGDRFEPDRLRMVDRQIRRRGIRDPRVLGAMETVPRHLFVRPGDLPAAYDDNPLPIGYDQTISQPYIVALMTELLEIQPTHRVLEIGTGSGYQAAVLSLLAADVFSIEYVEALGRESKERLRRLGYENVHVRIGDGNAGWPDESPFDGIIVTAAPEACPPRLVDQLVDGGRIVIPVGIHIQELYLMVKRGGRMSEEKVANVRFVPMVGKRNG